jgi:hypothetical protein
MDKYLKKKILIKDNISRRTPPHLPELMYDAAAAVVSGRSKESKQLLLPLQKVRL